MTGNSDVRGFPPFPELVRVGLTVPTLLVQTVWFILNPSFPSESLEFENMLEEARGTGPQ